MSSKMKEKIIDICIIMFMVIFSLLVFYPFYYVIINSFNARLMQGPALFWPGKLSVHSYITVFATDRLINAFLISASRTIIGLFTCVLLCAISAFALRKKELKFRNFYLILFTIPMFFSGGLIPTYLNLRNLNLLNNFLVYIIPPAWSFFSVIIIMTAFNDLPESLEECARLDGASYTRILFTIFIPLSIPVLAVIALFQGVDHWNSWFDTMYYTTNPKLMTLAGILIQIINSNQVSYDQLRMSSINLDETYQEGEVIKLVTIVISIVPIVMIYPFFQRFFVKGLTIGSIKG